MKEYEPPIMDVIEINADVITASPSECDYDTVEL